MAVMSFFKTYQVHLKQANNLTMLIKLKSTHFRCYKKLIVDTILLFIFCNCNLQQITSYGGYNLRHFGTYLFLFMNQISQILKSPIIEAKQQQKEMFVNPVSFSISY